MWASQVLIQVALSANMLCLAGMLSCAPQLPGECYSFAIGSPV